MKMAGSSVSRPRYCGQIHDDDHDEEDFEDRDVEEATRLFYYRTVVGHSVGRLLDRGTANENDRDTVLMDPVQEMSTR